MIWLDYNNDPRDYHAKRYYSAVHGVYDDMSLAASWLRKARWSLALPVVAVILTSFLLLMAERQMRGHYSLEYTPYALTAAWVANGPSFLPSPFPSPINSRWGDRIYSAFMGWLFLGAFLDWGRNHPSELLLAKRSTRLVVFGTATVILAALTSSLAHHLLWEDGMTPESLWLILMRTNFHDTRVTLCVLFVWLSAILIWSASNLFYAARLQRSR
jgi:hypothetical protein